MRKRFETLWAIRPEATMTVLRLIARDMAATPPVTDGNGKVVMVGTSWTAAKPTVQGPTGNKVAVIPVQGVLTNDGPSYYGTNYQTIADPAEKAAADPDVKRIILSVDSPGGEVTGLPETAAVLARVNAVKPISAIVEGASASAAYWLTSQASDITLTPSGEVGSAGVRMMHVDMSQMLANEGYKVTEMHSGDFKTEWSPYQTLSDDAKADMQTRLDASHRDFINAVSKGRGGRVSAETKRSRFGEGRMFSSTDALKQGLVDRVQPTREFYQALTATSQTRPSFGATRDARAARLSLERVRV